MTSTDGRLIVGRDDIAVQDDDGRWWRIDDEPATAVRQLVAAVTKERDEARDEAARVGVQRANALARVAGLPEAALNTSVAGLLRRVATQHQDVTELVERHMAEIARELDRVGRVLPAEPATVQAARTSDAATEDREGP